MQQMPPPKMEPDPPKAKQMPAPRPQSPQSLLHFLHLDSDVLLILPLVLLLSREGADNALLLALLYIML